MVERVYPTESNKATFICPKCKRSKTVDVTKFTNTSRTVRVNSTCSCGHKWTSVLEKRKQYRKATNLPGTYALTRDGNTAERAGMKVTDVSAGGVKLKLNVQRDIKLGDHMNIEFHLDDSKRTLIKKDVVVRNVDDLYIGVAFRSTDPYDPKLGFYLMS